MDLSAFCGIEMPYDFLEFGYTAELLTALADRVAYELCVSIEEKGQATFAVCTQAFLQPFFVDLSRRDINWEKVTVTLVDERCVPISCERSHEGFLRAYFLKNYASKAKFIGLYTPSPTAELTAFSAAKRINTIIRPLDVVLLTLAEEGHIGSYLAGAMRLKQALDRASKALVLPIYGKNAQDARLSLTLPLLAEARFIALPFQGAAQRELFQQALQTHDERFASLFAVLKGAFHPVQMYWCPQATLPQA